MSALKGTPQAAACPRCQATFECNATSGKTCWCAALPALRAIDLENAACLCPTCLARALSTQVVR